MRTASGHSSRSIAKADGGRDADPTLAALLGEVFGAPCFRKSDPPMGRRIHGWWCLGQNAFGKLVARRYFGSFERDGPVRGTVLNPFSYQPLISGEVSHIVVRTVLAIRAACRAGNRVPNP